LIKRKSINLCERIGSVTAGCERSRSSFSPRVP
jgi:hypothetical protein